MLHISDIVSLIYRFLDRLITNSFDFFGGVPGLFSGVLYTTGNKCLT